MSNSKDQADDKPTRRPYESPKVVSEDVFERMALACPTTPQTNAICPPAQVAS